MYLPARWRTDSAAAALWVSWETAAACCVAMLGLPARLLRELGGAQNSSKDGSPSSGITSSGLSGMPLDPFVALAAALAARGALAGAAAFAAAALAVGWEGLPE